MQSYHLSPQQKRAWLLQQQYGTTRAGVCIRIDGPVQHQRLEKAVGTVHQTFHILRTRYELRQSHSFPFQVVDDSSRAAYRFVRLAPADPAGHLARVEALFEEYTGAGRGEETAGGLQYLLIEAWDHQFFFVISAPALSLDADSLTKLFEKIMAEYGRDPSRDAGGDPSAAAGDGPQFLQYAQYAAWQHENLQAARQGENYFWDGNDYQDHLHVTIPAQQTGWRNAGNACGVLTWQPGPDVLGRIAALAGREEVAPPDVWLAAWQVLLGRLTNRQAPVVGLLTPGREHQILQNTLGLLAKVLPVRLQPEPGVSFARFVRQVHELRAQVSEWQDDYLPGAEAAEAGELPLFPYLFSYQNQGLPGSPDGTFRYAVHKRCGYPDRFALGLFVVESEDALTLELHFNRDGFAGEDSRYVLELLEQLLQNALSNPDAETAAIPLVPAGEPAFARGSSLPVPPATLTALFEQQAQRWPHRAAVVSKGETITYGQLNAQADRLARVLRACHRVQPGQVVALVTERGGHLLTGMLGILKAGAAYLPLEPGNPPERLAAILKDSGAAVVVTQGSLPVVLPPALARVDLENAHPDGEAATSAEAANLPGRPPQPDDLAYVIYTSGSTGTPKGVMVEHQSVVNLIAGLRESVYAGHQEAMKVALLASCQFDASVQQLFFSLTGGHTLYVVDAATKTDPDALVAFVLGNAIESLDCTPSLLGVLLEAMPEALGDLALRYVLVGGEAWPPALLDNVYKLGLHHRIGFFNLYGPTECTVDATCFRLPAEALPGSVPMGRPLANCHVYVLNAAGQPVPRGTTGELYIGGAGLSRGYLGAPALSDASFIANPFGAGGKLYRTGDFVRWDAAGNLHFVGRQDTQVKIRGYRVDVTEVETQLARCPHVTAQVVLARPDARGEYCLAAYVAGPGSTDTARITAFLKERLPAYMVPDYLVVLKEMPLNTSGKIDRNALPDPASIVPAGHHRAPTTPTERALTAIWQEVLKKEGIGTEDAFFEIGGHSLKAIQIVSRIHQTLHVKVGLADLFANPTIGELAQRVDNALREGYQTIEPVAGEEYYGLSHSQQGLWAAWAYDKSQINFNVPLAYTLEGELHEEAFGRAFQTLVARHESLRTTFHLVDDTPRQKVWEAAARPFRVECLDVRNDPDQAARVRGITNQEARTQFDLEKGPLIRARLLRTGDRTYTFLLTMHHIVSDGWSTTVLVNEVMQLYRAYRDGSPDPLPPLRIHYKDYAAWHNGQLAGPGMALHREYWLGQLGSNPPQLKLPADFVRPAVKTGKGGLCHGTLGPEVTRLAHEACQAHGVSLFVLLLASVKAFLYRCTGDEDLVIGTPVAGRDHKDLEDQIGFFVNLLALRTRLDGEAGFDELLSRVKQTTLAAHEHQLYPFDLLVDELKVERDLSRSPLFQTVVMLQNEQDPADRQAAGEQAGLKVENAPAEVVTSRFDLSFNFRESDGEIRLGLVYSQDLFRRATVVRLLDNYGQFLQEILLHRQAPLRRVAFLPVTAAEPAAAHNRERDYWLKKLAGELPVSGFPADLPAAGLAAPGTRATVPFRVEGELLGNLLKISNGSSQGLHMILLAGLGGLLNRYNPGEPDVVVGTPIYKQQTDGDYINTILVLRTGFTPGTTFRSLLMDTRQTITDAVAHQNYAYETLRYQLDLPAGRALFEVGLALQDVQEERHLHDHNPRMAFSFLRGENRIDGVLSYDASRYAPATAARIARHYQQFLAGALADVNKPLRGVSLFTDAERRQLLDDFNAPAPGPGPRETGQPAVVSLFEDCAARVPGQVALRTRSAVVTYQALNGQANQVARLLRDRYGVGSGDLVALMVDRSPAMIATLLGILKAGAAYVPVDPGYPVSRINYLIENGRCKFIITSTAYGARLADTGPARLIAADDLLAAASACPAGNLPATPALADTAYVIYTSGSTGNPKGVVISHASLSAYLCAAIDLYFGPGEEGNMGLFTPLSFDFTVTSIFCTLLRGRELFVYDQQEEVSEVLSHSFRSTTPIDVIKLTPAHISLLENLEIPATKVGKVIVGGEELTARQVSVLRRINPAIRIYNEYGPTEATVGCIVKEVEEACDPVLIGRPLANTQAYILDADLALLPVGAKGEICLSGTGLARGYLHNEGLTREKFVPHPFRPGQYLYRTGDLGRWLPNGEIAFLGRNDNQVKVRGYRIELGEIENRLLAHPRVREAAVLVHPGDGHKDDHKVVAYLVTDGYPAPAELRTYLEDALPAYMVPTLFVQLEAMPLTPNGKVDRKALARLEGNAGEEAGYAPARTDVERHLAAIWEKVLRREGIGIDDNFFRIGGHSIKAIVVITQVAKAFSVKLETKDIFMRPTIRGLAGLISQAPRVVYQTIPVAEKQPHYDLSPAQYQLWALDQLHGAGAAYNVVSAYRLEGSLDRDAFGRALAALVARHEILRTDFVIFDGQPKQKVRAATGASFAVNYLDLRPGGSPEAEARRLVAAEGEAAFDLAKGPLLRATLLQLAADAYVFVLTLHHIIYDGWSNEVLVDEVLTLYKAFSAGKENPLPPPRLQYVDYAVWQNQQLADGRLKEARQYWLERFSDEVPVLALTTDSPRLLHRTYQGDDVGATLSPGEVHGLNQFCQDRGVSPFMALLTVLKALLHRYTGQTSLVVSTPVAGREQAELEDQIGYYVNTVPIRTDLAGSLSLAGLLEKVKETSLNAFAHQSYPLNCLVEDLQREQGRGIGPLFEVVAVMHNAVRQHKPKVMQGVAVAPFPVATRMSKFDLTFSFEASDEGLNIAINYNTGLFARARIERMLGHFRQLLGRLLANPDCALAEVRCLPETEEAGLLRRLDHRDVAYPREQTIVDLFEARAARAPQRPALVAGSKRFTYGELNGKANQLAHALRSGFAPAAGQLVGLISDRTENIPIGVLGILKAGAAYLPLDPSYPRERIDFILRDAGVQLLVADSRQTCQLLGLEHLPVVVLEELEAAGAALPAQNPAVRATPESLAYVMYTSGTTGRPKGVMVEHRQVVRLLFHDRQGDYFQFGETDVWTLFHSFCFDFSVWELFGALLYGGTLVVPTREEVLNPRAYVQLLRREGVTVLNQTPSVFLNLAAHVLAAAEVGPADGALALRYVIFGGEALSPASLRRWHARFPHVRLINMYGITETTVHVTYKALSGPDLEEEVSNIGKPLATLSVYLLDEHGQLVPEGMPGEIYVGGAGVSRGYLNRPDLTAERFVPNPYDPQERLYRSGDLARMLPGGELCYLGRKDSQVKVRGYRIELAEVENKLLNYPGLEKGMVLTHDGSGGEKQLVAYYTSRQPLNAREIRAFLLQSLPGYMVPSHFVQLNDFPCNANGKIDRAALPDPEKISLTSVSQIRQPENQVEESLLILWTKVLNRTGIGIDHNFFEVGGDSMKVMKLFGAIEALYPRVLKIPDLFEHATIAGQSEVIINAGKTAREAPGYTTIQL